MSAADRWALFLAFCLCIFWGWKAREELARLDEAIWQDRTMALSLANAKLALMLRLEKEGA